MSHDTLLNDAFLLGTGVTRESALRSPRYKELLTTFPRLPDTTREQTAEMALLGEMLAARAFKNLPPKLRTHARSWGSYSDEQRLAALTELKETLGDKSYRHRHSSQDALRDVDQPENRALPQQYKSWVRNPARPSCLGLAQMLIGFGEVTGAPCLLIDVLQPHYIHTSQLQYLRTQQLLELLNEHTLDQLRFTKLRQITEEVRDDALELLVTQHEGQQAHHALAIKIGDEWWIVDPYFDTISSIGIDHRTLDNYYREATAEKPRMSGCVISDQTFEESLVDHRLTVLKDALSYMPRLNEPLSSWSHEKAAYEPICQTNAPYETLSTEEGRSEYMYTTGRGIVMSYTTAYRMKAAQTRDPDGTSQLFEECITLCETNKRYRNQVYLRAMKILARECLLGTVGLSLVKLTAKKQEFAHPTFQLAVRTLNQLGMHRGIDTPELSLYSSGQWILHDTLDAVRKSTSKRLNQRANNRIKHIAKHPGFALPEIHYLLESVTS